MNKIQTEILERNFGIELSENKIHLFNKYEELFLNKNAQLNLISKNDAKYLFEKHIFDSLAINLFLKPKNEETLLDIGTGGGFPSVPISILYDKITIFALDSIRKKINAIDEIKNELNLSNLNTICERIENNNDKYDYVTTRAVASLDKILKYAIPHLKKDGYFIAYKSQKINEELDEAKQTIKNLRIKIIDKIEYDLPLEENFKRNLVIFQSIK